MKFFALLALASVSAMRTSSPLTSGEKDATESAATKTAVCGMLGRLTEDKDGFVYKIDFNAPVYDIDRNQNHGEHWDSATRSAVRRGALARLDTCKSPSNKCTKAGIMATNC